MSLDPRSDDEARAELDLRDELRQTARALRAHVEVLMSSGGFGTVRSEAPVGPSVTEPPPSMAPAAPIVAERQRENRASVPTGSGTLAASAPSTVPLEERQRRLDVLASSITNCAKCRLHEKRKQTVFARGTGSSGLCFVGEGPGADEDAQGFPFVGAAGQLLDRMIAAMGLLRDEVYVCNIVKCRPPDNRKPLPDEMSTCKPYLEEQLEILAPDVIVALGATAVEGLLGLGGGITRLRGNWRLYKGRIAVMPTFHPAYLLRAPNAKHAVWEDLQAVLRHLGRSVPVRGKKQ
jgi:uracil-DNA glycosylase